MIALIPILIALLGLVVYLIATNPKAAELGRLAYLAAMIALCVYYAGHLVHLG